MPREKLTAVNFLPNYRSGAKVDSCQLFTGSEDAVNRGP